mmetsp:Transcript_24227/g.81485  ORF Transcript_24227/g.81485 Transcript_24227/m.81485 type:complete len:493 (+) Transcript_24227:106-1584(+)
MADRGRARDVVDDFLGAVNYIEFSLAVLSLVFIPCAAYYVVHHRSLSPQPSVVHLRLMALVAAFTWVGAMLIGDDALWHVANAMFDGPVLDPREYASVCLTQKTVILAFAEPAFLLLMAQLVQAGRSQELGTGARPRGTRALLTKLVPLVVLHIVFIFTENLMPVRVVIVASSEVPTQACIVPTANLLLGAVFTVAFVLYFNLVCHRLSRIVINRSIKQRLWFYQMWLTVALPLLQVIRLLLIIGFGFASRIQLTPDTFLSGLLASRALLDVQFAIVLVSAMLGIRMLVWRPMREIDVLQRPRRKLVYVKANGSQADATDGDDAADGPLEYGPRAWNARRGGGGSFDSLQDEAEADDAERPPRSMEPRRRSSEERLSAPPPGAAGRKAFATELLNPPDEGDAALESEATSRLGSVGVVPPRKGFFSRGERLVSDRADGVEVVTTTRAPPPSASVQRRHAGGGTSDGPRQAQRLMSPASGSSESAERGGSEDS